MKGGNTRMVKQANGGCSRLSSTVCLLESNRVAECWFMVRWDTGRIDGAHV